MNEKCHLLVSLVLTQPRLEFSCCFITSFIQWKVQWHSQTWHALHQVWKERGKSAWMVLSTYQRWRKQSRYIIL